MNRGQFLELASQYRRALVVLVLLLLFIALYPFQITIVPQWGLRVVDDARVAVPRVNVTEHWQHYLFDSEAEEEIRTTQDDGSVNFPARTMRASLLHRGVAAIMKLSRYGNRARLHPYASVVVWGSKTHETTVAVYRSPDPPQPEISIHRLP